MIRKYNLENTLECEDNSKFWNFAKGFSKKGLAILAGTYISWVASSFAISDHYISTEKISKRESQYITEHMEETWDLKHWIIFPGTWLAYKTNMFH